MFACMQAAFVYTIAQVAVGLVCIHFPCFSLIMSHVKVSVFLVCVVKLMSCPTIKYWLATPLFIHCYEFDSIAKPFPFHTKFGGVFIAAIKLNQFVATK